MKYLEIIATILMIILGAYILGSWIEIIAKNTSMSPQYFSGNLFIILFK